MGDQDQNTKLDHAIYNSVSFHASELQVREPRDYIPVLLRIKRKFGNREEDDDYRCNGDISCGDGRSCSCSRSSKKTGRE